MYPLLTVLAGFATGAVGIRMARSSKPKAVFQGVASAGASVARDGLDAAKSGMREAAVAGLGSIEQASGRLRAKLSESGTGSSPAPTDALQGTAPSAGTSGDLAQAPGQTADSDADPAASTKPRRRKRRTGDEQP